MKTNISSLNKITLTPETNEEKLIVDSWYGKKAVCNFSIYNAAMQHPLRYVRVIISFEAKEEVSDGLP